MAHHIRVSVNGISHEALVTPDQLLVDWLRDDRSLTGTKVGCLQGSCGACTVHMDGIAVKSCLLLAVQADGVEITTVEGLLVSGQLDPLQQAFVEHGAVQCGFCTPGMLMAAKELLAEQPNPDEAQIRSALSSNLCRCTGYAKIVSAVQEVVKQQAGKGS